MKNPIALQIFFWVEAIISGRILLVTIPIMINKCKLGRFSNMMMDDWMILVLSLTALIFLAAGIAAIAGFRYWKMIHYIGAVLALVLTAGLLQLISATNSPFHWGYAAPVLAAAAAAYVAATSRLQQGASS